jgi:serine/threonine protein kinase
MLQLNWEDIFMEDLLGVGGFGSVCLVTCPKLRKSLETPVDDASVDSLEDCIPSEGSWASESMSTDSEYLSKCHALKCLSNRTMSCPEHFMSGAADLVGEAFLLSRLSHPNIIRLYGVTAGCIKEAFLKKGGYFLVMEALDSTLNDLIQVWRRDPVSSVQDFFNKSKSVIPSMEERLMIAMGVAKGMRYLHSQRIIFRDLKPHNVGLDIVGNVRLFDFGLARETTSIKYPGVAGSLRYMAPETITHSYTCQASDVYAFGVLLWEVCSLTKPYPKELHRPSDFKKTVALVVDQPPDIRAMNHPIKALVECCSLRDWTQRPSFDRIVTIIAAHIDNSHSIPRAGSFQKKGSIQSLSSSTSSFSFRRKGSSCSSMSSMGSFCKRGSSRPSLPTKNACCSPKR